MRRRFLKLAILTLCTLAVFTALIPVSYAQSVIYNNSGSSSSARVDVSAVIPAAVLFRMSDVGSVYSISRELIPRKSNIPTRDLVVNGNLISNLPSANVQCSLSSTTLSLINGNSSILVNLGGTIGGTRVSTRGFTPVFRNRAAPISITGDLDESSLSDTKPLGTYSGTFTINAALL